MRILCKVKPSSLDQSISPDLSSHKFKAHKIRRSVALDPQVTPDPPLPKENVRARVCCYQTGAPVSLKKRKNLIEEAIWSRPLPKSGMGLIRGRPGERYARVNCG
jgi:hypothetical protein